MAERVSSSAWHTALRLSPARAPVRQRGLLVVGLVCGTIAGVAPWLGQAVGLTIGVRARVEVVDHVLPGVLAIAASLISARSAAAGARAPLLMVAGFWMSATHVPLVAQAWRREISWELAALHATPGAALLVLAVALWLWAGRAPLKSRYHSVPARSPKTG
jgi:hypothetical protein